MKPPIATTSAELLRLCTLVNRAQHAAIREGMTPTEVWLGPEHHATVGSWLHPVRAPNRPAGEFSGTFISGLRVRLSAESGVWVGTTYGMKP
jgi:hypothetical protein